MKNEKIHLEDLGATLEISSFLTQGGVAEWHVMLHVEPRTDCFMEQYNRILKAQETLMTLTQMQGATPVFKRYFLSDSTNQQPLMQAQEPCTISFIQQPPLDGSKLALWIYLQKGTDITSHADRMDSTIVLHNGYRHIWTMGMVCNEGDSHQQTKTLLEDYENLLTDYSANIADHCLRTWFFVRDVDTQYKGLVVARRENFIQQGLTPETHYISSTGIGGNPADPKALVQMGCYTLTGFQPQQQQYLYALTHLNRTIEYGVTFERGTLFRYGDRNHAYISGTASINNKGEVLHLGDIIQQTHRMWENVEALLQEGDMTMEDAAQFIVYLRDTADYEIVRQMFQERFPNIPTVITLAPVCRPTWLIEMECIAIKEAHNEEFPAL